MSDADQKQPSPPAEDESTGSSVTSSSVTLSTKSTEVLISEATESSSSVPTSPTKSSSWTLSSSAVASSLTSSFDDDPPPKINWIVKWNGQEYRTDEDLDCTMTIHELKQFIYAKTTVLPIRQKILGLKLAPSKPLSDEMKLGEFKLRAGSKIMMIGSREEDIELMNSAAVDPGAAAVLNDLDIPDDVTIPVQDRQEFLDKITNRIRNYKVTILNAPRAGKRLLVLDIDYTLFDHRSVAETAYQLMRPYLHEFLTLAYEDYDIIIWSATSMKWIEVKMRELGVASNPHYKIVCYLDNLAMISINAPGYGLLNVKPLGVIWGKYDQYTQKNTIMFDDVRRNFLMNPKNGLKIKPFKEAFKNRESDKELYYLSRYLKKIAKLDDFNILDHGRWQQFIKEKRNHPPNI